MGRCLWKKIKKGSKENMSMKGIVLTKTVMDDEVNQEDIKELCGRMANICKKKGCYDEAKDTSVKRFKNTIKRGHHGVADKYKVTLEIQEIPKIIAIILNSLNDYCTLERSARYTIMEGTTERENELYNKWLNKLKEIIPSVYPNMGEDEIKILAMENARYMLSVFMKTEMRYTASIRQWNYIAGWCLDMVDRLDDKKDYFHEKLKHSLLELAFVIKCNSLLVDKETSGCDIIDKKQRSFEILAIQSDNMYKNKPMEQFGTSYTINYEASFVALADMIRHRTLDYYMRFNGESKKFFVPYILDDKLREEWLEDIKSVANVVPLGTLLDITETGNLLNFGLKLKERVCTRPQIEVTRNVTEQLVKMYNNCGDEIAKAELEKYIWVEDNQIKKIKHKCELIGLCGEPCDCAGWAIARLI